MTTKRVGKRGRVRASAAALLAAILLGGPPVAAAASGAHFFAFPLGTLLMALGLPLLLIVLASVALPDRTEQEDP